MELSPVACTTVWRWLVNEMPNFSGLLPERVRDIRGLFILSYRSLGVEGESKFQASLDVVGE